MTTAILTAKDVSIGASVYLINPEFRGASSNVLYQVTEKNDDGIYLNGLIHSRRGGDMNHTFWVPNYSPVESY